LTILIAEDDRATRSALAALLRDEGHHALAVSSGREALAACEVVHPDVLILDYCLPDMTGVDVLQLVGGRDAGPVALIVTANSLSAEARSAAHRLGARVFTKPVSPLEFLKVVRTACTGLA
jgi:DNA-binding response OmpR family regulator